MAHAFAVGSTSAETLTGTRTLTATEVANSSVFVFDPGGAARNLDLPAAGAANKGAILFITNAADAAEVITIRDGGSATVCTPTQAESAIVWSNGNAWYGIAGANS